MDSALEIGWGHDSIVLAQVRQLFNTSPVFSLHKSSKTLAEMPCLHRHGQLPSCCSSTLSVQSVQFSCSVVSDSATPWISARQASLSITNSQSLLKLMSIELVMPQPSRPLLSPSPPAHNPSQHQGLFQWVNSSHEVVKVLEFQLQRQSFQRTPRTNLL